MELLVEFFRSFELGNSDTKIWQVPNNCQRNEYLQPRFLTGRPLLRLEYGVSSKSWAASLFLYMVLVFLLITWSSHQMALRRKSET